jgi:hypothetical protein
MLSSVRERTLRIKPWNPYISPSTHKRIVLSPHPTAIGSQLAG